LNKHRTLALAADVSAAATSPRRRISLDPRVWLGAWALRRSVAAERKTLGPAPTPQDQKAFLPRDMALSYLQAQQEEWTATGVKFAEGASSTHGFDYHWVTAFLTELSIHLVRRVFFRLPRVPPNTTTLADDARLVLVGDWGTGEGAALAVAEQMRKQIDAAGTREVHVVHLGDVYYAGTRWEAHHRFLDHWPVRTDEMPRVRSWCLNGNHDMYSAGEGLFQVILTDGRFGQQRTEKGKPTSEFHLRSAHWDVFGLDTSWRFRLGDVRGGTGYLEPRQTRWVKARLDGSTRRRMLLSHHQPFTDREAGADVVNVGNLLAATADLREGPGIDAWFWGHEHRLITYGSRSGIRYAACMGHGAVLEDPALPNTRPAEGDAEFRATFRDTDGDEWRMPGFAVIDLDGASATVRYLDMNGELWGTPTVL
jgi:hypothetical protein